MIYVFWSKKILLISILQSAGCTKNDRNYCVHILHLNDYRNGCILCMDYSVFAMNSNYYSLVRDFNGIATVLTKKLKEFQALNFTPDNIYLFGFSFGAQLVLEAGRRFGKSLIKQIDVCDPAGPGFDNNLQCIHTSNSKGTRKRDCHQNWNMGSCGNKQAAAGPRPLGSHGLCPYFRYFNAMKYEGRFMEGQDFFANTFKKPPFNVEMDSGNIIKSEVDNFDYY